jgi:hypothetical protein
LTSLRGVKIGEKVMGDVLSTSELDSMALAVKNQSFAKGDVIIREGEKGDVFYVITKGSVVISKEGKQVGVTGVNTFIGEKALLSSDVRAATCVAETEVECLTLNRHDFVLLLGNLEDILAGKRKLVKGKSEWAAETTTYELNELEKKGVLGQGAFGSQSCPEQGGWQVVRSQGPKQSSYCWQWPGIAHSSGIPNFAGIESPLHCQNLSGLAGQEVCILLDEPPPWGRVDEPP